MKKEPAQQANNESAPQDCEDLEARLEKMLIDEGLIDPNPPPRRCRFCREYHPECIDYEGEYLKVVVCPDCYPDIDAMEYLLLETGKGLERYVLMGKRHFFFLEGGELWLIVATEVTKLVYFNPFGIGEDKVVSKLKTQLTFL